MIVKINENQYQYYVTGKWILNEDVFANAKNDKRKIANLKYNKHDKGDYNSDGTLKRTFNKGNLNSLDMLKTDKMDKLDNDTYVVPLKGGIMSYNITSINGTEAMHYFKRSFEQNQAAKTTYMKLNGEDYQLEMTKIDFEKFKEQFNAKVDVVAEWKINEFKQQSKDIEFTKVSIYPVPSSSKFNVAMASELSDGGSICGLPCQVIDSSILRKDTSKLQKDDEFIEKNKDYYNSRRMVSTDNEETHLDAINTNINRLNAQSKIVDNIKYINNLSKKIQQRLNSNRKKEKYGDIFLKNISSDYQKYCTTISELNSLASYIDAKGNSHTPMLSKLIQVLKYSKPKSIADRTEELYQIIKTSPYGKWLNRQNARDLCDWEQINFQIKSLGNDVRMGLKNYFQPSQEDSEKIRNEVEKTKGGIVVIFDDNVSGGATLADICLQLKNIGMEYLVPITFGQMKTSWNVGPLNITKPKDEKFNM